MANDFSVKIDKLIGIAKNYIDKANVDKNNSNAIEKEELSKLLAGTLATSIEDLTLDNIQQKMAARDTEQIFTAFMTDKSMQKNGNSTENYLDSAKSEVESNYNKLIGVTDNVATNLESIQTSITSISNSLKENNGDSVQPTEEQLNNVANTLLNVRSKILGMMNSLGSQYNSETLGQQYSTLSNMCDKLLAQIGKAQEQATGNSPKGYNVEYINQIHSVEEQIASAISDVKGLNTQYKTQKNQDLNMLKNLSQQQKEFIEDGIATDEEKDKAKQSLNELIQNTSPMARKIVIQAAENAYRDVTGIEPEDDNEPTNPTEPDEGDLPPEEQPTESSNINNGVDNNNANSGKYYTLGGQEVTNPTKPGIYIHNGKKIVIK